MINKLSTINQRQQIADLYERCAMAEDIEFLKHELYCYDPERFIHFSPVAGAAIHISFWDVVEAFKAISREAHEQR